MAKKNIDEPKAIGKGGPQPTTEEILRKEFADPTAQPQAVTRGNVNGQDSATRLWQSLDYAYNNQIDKSNKSYEQAYSQADRQALSRGMGRSSYNNQTLANINQQKIEAANDIEAAKIADYQNRLTTLEQQEKEDAWRQKDYELQKEQLQTQREQWAAEFGAGRSDTAWQQQFQKEQADTSKSQWEAEFGAGREDTAWQQGFQQKQADIAQQQWQADYDAGRSDTAWQQGFQEQQAETAKSQWEAEFGAGREDAEWQRQYQQEQAQFQREQWEEQKAEWREQFDYSKKTTEQKAAMDEIMRVLEVGRDATDSQLQRAGITRDDFNAMKKKSSSKKTTTNPPPTNENPQNQGPSDQQLLGDITGSFGLGGAGGTGGTGYPKGMSPIIDDTDGHVGGERKDDKKLILLG